MDTSPKISVVLPVYNGERYLRDSIESVLAQEYGDYELIIWDDASQDKSAEIIGKNKDNRLRSFTSNQNMGLFKTLNLAIGEARGQLIRLWSQDDVMKPNCLSVEVEFHARHPEAAMVHCLYDVIDESGVVVIPASEPVQPAVFSPQLAAQMMFYYGCLPGSISNVSLKRSVFDSVGLFREDLIIAGDFEMWVRIAGKHCLGYIDKSLLCVRAHRGQLSNGRGSYVIAMKEEQPLYESLMKRLPAEIRDYAKWYDLFRRYPMYLHHMIRRLLVGDFENAMKAYGYVSHSKHTVLVALFWLLTVNQRLYRMKPKLLTS